MHLLEPFYKQYTTVVSTPSAAISLESAVFLWNLCEERQPKVLADTGSGFSSFIIRLWSKNKDVVVYSFDDNDFWIQKSIDFSRENDVNTDNFLIWDSNTELKNIDILFHDLGNMTTRAETLSKVFNMTNKEGLIVLDDLHKSEYDIKARTFFKKCGYEIKKIPETIDSYGRFLGIVDMSKKM